MIDDVVASLLVRAVWLIMMPVIWLGVTPYIFLAAVRGPGRYLRRVVERYSQVTHWWAEAGTKILDAIL